MPIIHAISIHQSTLSNKVVLLLTFLLLNSFIISCGYKGGKGEKGKLEAEEKVLIDKLKKQLKPELQEKDEKVFKKDKTKTKQVFENSINFCQKILQDIAELEKGHNINPDKLDYLRKKSEDLEGASPVLKNNIAILKIHFSTLTELYQNFKKQAELKK